MSAQDPVDVINSASKERLIKELGLTEGSAEKVIAERPFASIDDVKRVPYFGDGKVNKLKIKINLSAAFAASAASEPVPDSAARVEAPAAPAPTSAAEPVTETHADEEKDGELPWHSDRRAPYPPSKSGGFTDRQVRAMPKHDGDNVYWAGREYPREVWDKKVKSWEARFPNIVEGNGNDKRTMSNDKRTIETLTQRTQATSSERFIVFCWDACDHTQLGTKWVDKFRVDPYGNVVAHPVLADNHSLTKFDVDHMFPWSRGGRSVKANFSACQNHANRFIKKDHLLVSLSPKAMQCGLSVTQFLGLMEFAEQRAGGKSNRSNSAKQQARVKGWLTSGPGAGEGLYNFAAKTRGMNAEQLWTFFESWFDKARAVGEDDAARANESAALAALKLRLEAAEARAAAAEARVASLEKEQLSRARDDTLCFPCFSLRSK